MLINNTTVTVSYKFIQYKSPMIPSKIFTQLVTYLAIFLLKKEKESVTLVFTDYNLKTVYRLIKNYFDLN